MLNHKYPYRLIVAHSFAFIVLAGSFVIASIAFAEENGGLGPAIASPHSTVLDPGFTAGVSDGYTRVEAVAVQSDGKLLVGGSFTVVDGAPRQGVARLNADGSLDNSFSVVTGLSVFDIVVQPDGKILLAHTGTGISRLNADGSPDATFTPGSGTGPSSVSDILLLPSGKIIISGGFTSYNGTAVSRIARLNSDGTLDTSFTPPTINSSIHEAARLSDEKIVIAGGFTTIGGITRQRVARLNTDGSLDTSFDAGTVSGNRMSVAVQSDGKTLVGGTPQGITRYTATGTVDGTFISGYQNDSTVHSMIVLPDGSILAGGAALSDGISYLGSFGVVKLTATGSFDPAFTKPENIGGGYEVFSIALTPDGKIFAGGDLYKLGSANTVSSRIAKLNADGTVDNSFTGTVEGYGVVKKIAVQQNGKLLVGGGFEQANGSRRPNIVRFETDGTVDSSFSVVTDFDVSSIAAQTDGKVVILGGFSFVNGEITVAVARLNSDGSLDQAFSSAFLASMQATNISVISNTFGDVVVLPDNKLLVAARFYDSPTFQTRGILRLNSDGSIDTTFNPGGASANNIVYRVLRQPDGKVIIVGNFTTYNGTSRPRVARLNVDGTLDTSFTPGTGANSLVSDAALQADGKVVIVGSFTSYNGTPANRIARLNADGSLDASFNIGSGADNTINAVSLQLDGTVWIGGSFTTFSGQSRRGLAHLNAAGALDAGFTAGTNGSVNAFLSVGDQLYVGGGFTEFEGISRKSLLRLTIGSDPAPNFTLFDYDGDGRSDLSVRRPSNNNWYLLRGTAGYIAQQFGVAGDKLVPADYDGDGKTDVAVFRPSNGTWYVHMSQSQTFQTFGWGQNGDLPVPTDRDDDGKTDLVIFRPSNNTWYTRFANATFNTFQFGAAGDKPMLGDFDGDGKGDVALFRPSNNNWYIIKSGLGYFVQTWGQAGDLPTTGDFDGDGKTDQAVFRPSTGQWFLSQTTAGFSTRNWGQAGDVPVAADYDGDGKADTAVFRPATGTWYIVKSRDGILVQQFGQNGDIPTQSAYSY